MPSSVMISRAAAVSYTHLDVYKRQLVALTNDDLGQVRELVAAGGLQHVLGDLGLALLPGSPPKQIKKNLN